MATTPKRIWNPPNPYLSEHAEFIGEAPQAEPEVYEDASKSVISKSQGPETNIMWSVNPYRGCFHACAYCYARPTHEYLGLGAGTDFERKIFVKRRAPELLEAAFRRPSWRGQTVTFSGVTDCYQPLEAAFGVTRGCLEVCLKYRNPIAIITKSLLIRRDAELLAALAREASATVFFSIPFLDEEIARVIEPGAPTVRKRFETMEILAKAGVPVGISVSPVIPGLNDSDAPGLLKEAKARGARYAFHTLLHLPGSSQEVFFHRVREALPLKSGKIENQLKLVRGGELSSRWQPGKGRYWDIFKKTWSLWTRRLDFNPEGPDRPSTFRRPAASAIAGSAKPANQSGRPADRPAGQTNQLEFAW